MIHWTLAASLVFAAGAAAAQADDIKVSLLAPCGHLIRYPDSGSEWRKHPARDEGGGFVSQLTEVSGDFAHRELELIDCRGGAEHFAGDVLVSSGATLPLPQGTPFQSRLTSLRAAGKLRDLWAAAGGFGDTAQHFGLDVDWVQNVHAACACEHFYPGTSGLPADQVPAPNRVHGVDAPTLDAPVSTP